MSKALKIMDEIEQDCSSVTITVASHDWDHLRKAVETDAENLDRYRNGFQGSCYACEPVGMKNQELEEELAQAKQWINDLQAGMYINCVYCGHRYGPESEVPASMADALKEHIEQCPEHPMSRLKEELAMARARIERLEKALRPFTNRQFRKGFESIQEGSDCVIYQYNGAVLHLTDFMAAKDVLNESPRQSLAAVKAEALREYAQKKHDEADRAMNAGQSWEALHEQATELDDEADRIEQENES